jgi:hypothetical protein
MTLLFSSYGCIHVWAGDHFASTLPFNAACWGNIYLHDERNNDALVVNEVAKAHSGLSSQPGSPLSHPLLASGTRTPDPDLPTQPRTLHLSPSTYRQQITASTEMARERPTTKSVTSKAPRRRLKVLKSGVNTTTKAM